MAHTEQSLSVLSKDDLARLVLDYKGKFDRMLKTVMDDICDLIHKFNALELELHISKTENAMHMSNIREGSVWTYQAFLVVSMTLLWKKLFWTYFQKLMPLSNLQTLKIVIALSWPIMPLKILPWNCQNEKIYIECQKLTLALKMLPLLKLVYLLASSICFQPKLVQVFKFLWSKLKKR